MGIETAVVLAAGEGTRLRPLTYNRPKPMLPAANRPILEYVLDALIDAGLDHVCVVVGYKRDRVQNHFGPTYRGVPLTYAVQQKQLGTGHALLRARDAAGGPVLVVNGDSVVESGMVADVAGAFERYDETAIGVLERPDARRYGAVDLRGDHIEELVEKPDSDEYRLINAGVYAFGESIFDAIEETPRREGELALTDTIARLLDEGVPIRGVRRDGLWADAVYPWDLLTVASELLARGRVHQPERAERVWVDETAQVHDDAVLQGPVVVGPDCEVGPGAVLGPVTALGRNVTVGANATVGRAVLDDDTRVGPGCTLLDFVAGQDAHLGAGTVVPGGSADVRVGTRVFEDQQLGAVFADRARTAGPASVAPGTLVGPNARVGAGAHARGNVPAGAEVVR